MELRVAALALAFLASASGAAAQPQVDSILRQMTLEEKVGQMTQLTIEAVSSTRGTATVEQRLDSAKLDDAIVRHHVGSLLNVWDVALTPRKWEEVLGAVQRSAGRARLKIPVIYGIDAVHGDHYMVGATVFPQNIAMAATWNPDLVRAEHEITAYETRASGITWNFAPVLDVGRQPLWSRFFETFGEDPYLGSVMGVAAVRAEQRYVAATGKHFLGYSVPLSGKDRTTAWIPERELREYFVPPFAAAITAGLRTIMVNSSDVNGVPVHASHEILTDLLRGELGFTGVVVTDWGDIDRLQTVHHIAATRKDAVRMAVMAGVDMSMVPMDVSFADDLIALVHEGAVPESRIDESVRRILALKYALGLFENAGPDPTMLKNVGSPASLAVSRQAAEEAVTLLKNDGLLPLPKTARVLVTGPGAISLSAQYGAWTFTWQGTDTAMYPKHVATLLDAIRQRATHATYVPDSAAANAARSYDVAVVCLAEPPVAEKPGDIDDLTMPREQLRLARAIEATGTPVVLALFQNRPRIIRDAVDSARAIVTGYETGPFGGEAVAEVLFGEVNPSGRLPFSWPRATGAIEHYDRTWQSEVTASKPGGGYDPEWAFGYGLSYTTFGYSDLRIDRRDLSRNDTLGVGVTVTNTGSRAGRVVVPLYVRERYASVDPPFERLRGFTKISLAPGERRDVTFRVPVHDLAFVGRDNHWVVEPGPFDVMIGDLADSVTVQGPGDTVQTWLTTGDQLKSLSHEPSNVLSPARPPGSLPVITVDEKTRYQQMIGFGAAFTDAATYLIAQKMSPGQREALLQELFSRANGLGLGFMRIPMGASDFSLSDYSYDDMPAGQTDTTLAHFSIDADRAYKLPVIQRALAINRHLTLMANPWSPPGWMKTTGNMIGGTLRPSAYGAFARYFAKFIQAYGAAGVPIAAISLQNEPQYQPPNYPGMLLDPATRALLDGHYVGPLFAKLGLHTMIWDWDHNWDLPRQPLTVLADTLASKYVQGVTWHCYAGDVSAQSTVHDAYPGKDTYFSECSGGDWSKSYPTNLTYFVGTLIIGTTRNWARSVALWNLALDENDGPHTGGCSNCRGVVTINSSTGAVTRNVEYYALAHASKFVRPGAYRIASASGLAGLSSVAFQNTDDQSIVAIVLNGGAQSSTFALECGRESLQYTLPPNSVVTFVWR
jgi:beta-glucosidase